MKVNKKETFAHTFSFSVRVLINGRTLGPSIFEGGKDGKGLIIATQFRLRSEVMFEELP